MLENLSFQDLMQIGFYIVSPIGTFLAVGIAYLAVYRQTKPNLVVYYEPSDVGSVINLVISNNGTGTARNIEFSRPLPIQCWGIEKPKDTTESGFINEKIPILAPGKELRYQAGQYGGLLSVINERYELTAKYTYRTPLRDSKKGSSQIDLAIKHLAGMHSTNSVEVNLSDALLGRNSTIFKEINNSLKSINKTLTGISNKIDTSDGERNNGA